MGREREGFTLVGIPWWWGEIALLSNQFKWGGWIPNDMPLGILKGSNPLRMAEWGGSSFTTVSAWRRMGKTGMAPDPRSEHSRKMLSIWHAQSWLGGPGDLRVGTAWDETEVLSFQNEISRVRPGCAVLAKPSALFEFKDLPLKWSSRFWADGACTGDLVGGCRGVFFRYKEQMGATPDLSKAIPVMTSE